MINNYSYFYIIDDNINNKKLINYLIINYKKQAYSIIAK